jgi:hypothetical protein
MRGKRFNLGVTGVLVATLVVSIVFMGGCTRQSTTEEPSPPMPTPPTEPVPGTHTKGYVYVSILDFAFEYPEDWEMETPKVIDGEDTESIVMFTKPGTPTTLIVTVKLTNLTSLEEVKEEFREGLKGLGGTILEEREIVVNGREGYEVIYKPIAAVKIRQVIFIAGGKSYMLVCSTAEVLYDEYEETFNNVINSFVIKYYDSS